MHTAKWQKGHGPQQGTAQSKAKATEEKEQPSNHQSFAALTRGNMQISGAF